MSQGQPFDARKRAWSVTNRSNHNPADSFRLGVFFLVLALRFLTRSFFGLVLAIALCDELSFAGSKDFTATPAIFQATPHHPRAKTPQPPPVLDLQKTPE
jgi:hypothetical protein